MIELSAGDHTRPKGPGIGCGNLQIPDGALERQGLAQPYGHGGRELLACTLAAGKGTNLLQLFPYPPNHPIESSCPTFSEVLFEWGSVVSPSSSH